MITTLERLLRLLEDHDAKTIDNETLDPTIIENIYHEREIVERQLLLAPISSDIDAVVKTRFLSRIFEEGERSDGLDIKAMQGLIEWMEQRFVVVDHGFNRVVA